jgi:hypothetical protein
VRILIDWTISGDKAFAGTELAALPVLLLLLISVLLTAWAFRSLRLVAEISGSRF